MKKRTTNSALNEISPSLCDFIAEIDRRYILYFSTYIKERLLIACIYLNNIYIYVLITLLSTLLLFVVKKSVKFDDSIPFIILGLSTFSYLGENFLVL